MTRIVPAPWSLRGESFIQVLLNPVDAVRPLVPEAFEIQSKKGHTLGALMWVHYTSSPVGPYEELLFMPARVRYRGKTGYCITNIWVDSEDSVESGKENWLIPKRLGRMAFQTSGRAREARLEEEGVGTIALARFRCPAFPPPVPMHSAAFPMPLLQEQEGKRVFVPFGGWGLSQPVKGGFVIKDPRALPVPQQAKKFPPARLARFWLTFSRAQELA